MTKIKLWITDIDGTIMNYDGSITPKMVEIINKINNSSSKLILATGRMFQGADYVASKYNINNPVVCYQGAQVRLKDEILWQALIDNNLAREIIDFLRERNIHIHLYNNDILYVEKDDKRIMQEYCSGRGTTYSVQNFDEIKLDNVPKILCVIEDKNLMQETKKELKEKYENVLTVVQSSSKYLEINDIKASKGNALNFLKEYYHLETSQTLASGDQDNDIDMLLKAGIKVCVGYNSSKLREIADFKCESVNSDELCTIIERYVL